MRSRPEIVKKLNRLMLTRTDWMNSKNTRDIDKKLGFCEALLWVLKEDEGEKDDKGS